MRCSYRLKTNKMLDEEHHTHTVYGIEAWCGETYIHSVKDVFFEKRQAEDFISLCNQSDLYEEHLIDVITDVLNKTD